MVKNSVYYSNWFSKRNPAGFIPVTITECTFATLNNQLHLLICSPPYQYSCSDSKKEKDPIAGGILLRTVCTSELTRTHVNSRSQQGIVVQTSKQI